MDKTLGYLIESISNYGDENKTSRAILTKIMNNQYTSEEALVRDLDEEEIEFLNKILPDEINYAMDERDFKRVNQLNEVYELL
ncbi:sigma-G-dependent sporulation-specific acid-soluble spore protein CsgA [Bacillus sp. REN16]|uniref:sigma-G-dependent sporulation-specific acid-soluble spore protein CsgA n=1 Tax=Bacillus sp. REN16 TaxID=2887296 RepID=UPI001E3CA681|nr:sigma-G-dependent sporulation-specific acid-soluble spore protein CsgA [Bacillus sp. REN16]MCC3358370.1 sigma-G-dependent sporulation-specific acid-soluble spore protein CsgA [Bacillus sp. REN16]